MQYLKQIVTAINNSISAKLDDPRFQGAEYHGIAISAANEDNKLMPLVTDHYDDNRWVGIDDTLPLRLYHKNNGLSYSDDIKSAYGDGNSTKKEIASMSMIIYGSRIRLKLTPEELEGAIVSGLPSAIGNATLSALKIKSCMIRPASSILDPVANYTAEYRTNEYPLGPNALFIRINYIIESSYKNACFNICDC